MSARRHPNPQELNTCQNFQFLEASKKTFDSAHAVDLLATLQNGRFYQYCAENASEFFRPIHGMKW
jgi:hypothetical protein